MIFVTGGTGLLGAHLLFELTKTKQPIRAIFRSEHKCRQVHELFSYCDPANSDDRFAQIEWIKGDILDIPFLEEAMEDSSIVYHCAAIVSFHKRDFNQMMKVNREGTANMVNVALSKNVSKFCHVSSTAAIGGTDLEVITEETHWKNTPTTSGYSISKYSAEKEVWRAIEEGLDAVMVNPCVIVGAGSWDESSLTLFRTVKKGHKYYPPGANAIVDARDVATIMVRLANSEISAERYLCIGSNQSFKDLISLIAGQMGVRAPHKEVSRSTVNFVRKLLSFFAFITGRRSAITRETVNSLFSVRKYDNSKISNALDFEFRSLEDAVDNAVQGRLDQSKNS